MSGSALRTAARDLLEGTVLTWGMNWTACFFIISIIPSIAPGSVNGFGAAGAASPSLGAGALR